MVSYENCKRCGYCLYTCPSYKALGFKESSSPRGRLQLLEMLNRNVMKVSLEYIKRMYTCTLCNKCGKICVSGINVADEIRKARIRLIDEGYLVSPVIDEMATRLRNKGFVAGEPESIQARDAEVIYYPGCVVKNFAQDYGKSDYKIIASFLSHDARTFMPVCGGGLISEAGYEALGDISLRRLKSSLENLDFGRIVTSCPICLVRLEKIVGRDRVSHMTEVIVELEIKYRKRFRSKIAYFKPCYLPDERNKTLEMLEQMPGVEPIELKETGCCGGGGGVTYFAHEDSARKIAELMMIEAMSMGADIIVAPCPVGYLNLKSVEGLGKPKVLSPAQIVEKAASRKLLWVKL